MDVRSGDENVWIADADGANPKAITTGKDATYLSPWWDLDPELRKDAPARLVIRR